MSRSRCKSHKLLVLRPGKGVKAACSRSKRRRVRQHLQANPDADYNEYLSYKERCRTWSEWHENPPARYMRK